MLRKFFKNVKRLTERFKPGVSSCRDERCKENSEPASTDNNGVEIPPPSNNEVRVAIQRLKNKKAAEPDGRPAELFKLLSAEYGWKKACRLERYWSVSCPEKVR